MNRSQLRGDLYKKGIHPETRMDVLYNRYNPSDYYTNTLDEENKFNLNGNDYETVFSKQNNKQLSVLQELNITYDNREDYLVINTGTRDTVTYPNSCNFVLELNEPFKNVVKIELIQVIIPDKNNVQNQPYLLLKINELENVMLSNDKNISDSFAIIQLAPPTIAGTFIQCDKRITEYVKLCYRIPKAKLDKMTISLNDPLGNVFDFGANGSIDPSYQCTFVLKITSKEVGRKQLNQRNVYYGTAE